MLGINVFALGCLYSYRFVSHAVIPFEFYALPAYSWIIFYYCGLYVGQHQAIERRFAEDLRKWVMVTVLLFLVSCIEAGIIVKSLGSASFALSAIKFSSFAFSLSVIAVFIGVKLKIKSYPRMLLVIGNYSFGIYLIHMVILSLLLRHVNLMRGFPIFPVLFSTISTVLICMCMIYGSRKVFGRKISSEVFGL